MRRFNPAMNANVLQKEASLASGDVMTLKGAIQKSGILLALLTVSAIFAWSQLSALGEEAMATAQRYTTMAAIGGFVIAMLTIFLKKYAAFLAPLYALVEGLFLGSISMMMQQVYPGIVFQAVLGTMAVFAVMLFLYDRRVITVTNKFRSVMMTSGLAIVVLMLGSWIVSMFGGNVSFLYNGGPLAIGISLLIIGWAAFSLLLDFDMMEQFAGRTGKHMEWYCGFGLLLTLVLLYVEILRLLAMTRD